MARIRLGQAATERTIVGLAVKSCDAFDKMGTATDKELLRQARYHFNQAMIELRKGCNTMKDNG